jgi:hypothetical protein
VMASQDMYFVLKERTICSRSGRFHGKGASTAWKSGFIASYFHEENSYEIRPLGEASLGEKALWRLRRRAFYIWKQYLGLFRT